MFADFVLNLIVFVLSLALLIVVHEFGHYITAKWFNVYVSEFSIGFGPTLYQKKKEGGETQFSIRAVPLGGYCSIVGEALPEFTEEEYNKLSNADKELVDLYRSVPENRRLDGIPRYKRAVVMVAGVTLNFVLGLILLLCSNLFTAIPTMISNQVEISENSIASKANWLNDDVIQSGSYIITINGETVKQDSFECLDNTTNLYSSINILREHNPQTSSDIASYTLITTENKTIHFEISPNINQKDGKYYWPTIGLTFSKNYEKGTYYLSFGEAVSQSFSDFGDYSIAIFKALGNLFTKEGMEEVGGMIAIFGVQQQVMNMGFGYVIRLWAMISINLGIMNLLPFPGLDGWHLLVIAIEGATRKELPKKFKSIMSTIGMLLLFGLMILITFKDIFSLASSFVFLG